MLPKDKKGLALAAAALGAAIVTELKKPAEERTWTGKVAGVVPYDFRKPTADSVRDKLWNPAGNFWSPSVFGVGWSPNLGRIAAQTGLLGDETRQAVTGPAPAETGTAETDTDD
ncbi:MAG TPA: hypothetical protein VN969_08660 [Streptosporangiaceae bacterium]|jgi:hypothetical protein|nr:hypothetical protein [Streptosporangiaceae bacterium]